MNNSKCKRLHNNCPKSLVLKVSFLLNKKLGLRTQAITIELVIIIIIMIIIIMMMISRIIIIATTQ